MRFRGPLIRSCLACAAFIETWGRPWTRWSRSLATALSGARSARPASSSRRELEIWLEAVKRNRHAIDVTRQNSAIRPRSVAGISCRSRCDQPASPKITVAFARVAHTEPRHLRSRCFGLRVFQTRFRNGRARCSLVPRCGAFAAKWLEKGWERAPGQTGSTASRGRRVRPLAPPTLSRNDRCSPRANASPLSGRSPQRGAPRGPARWWGPWFEHKWWSPAGWRVRRKSRLRSQAGCWPGNGRWGDLVYRARRVGVGGERAASIRCSLVGHEACRRACGLPGQAGELRGYTGGPERCDE